MLVYSWRRQLNAGVQRLAVRAEAGLQASEEGREGDEDDAPLPLARAVGFADLVSYTSLSRRMNEKTLAQLVQRFENKCAEIISVGGGRLVKTVGDEVLYIAETPAAGAEISLALARPSPRTRSCRRPGLRWCGDGSCPAWATSTGPQSTLPRA